MLYNEFEDNEVLNICAGDFETLQYTNGNLLNDSELKAFYKECINGDIIHNISYAREHTTTREWACLIAYEEKFAICENVLEYLQFCKLHKVKQIWFYNAKFDFSFIDNFLLSNNFKQIENSKELKNNENSFVNLGDEYGARYKLSINFEKHIIDLIDFMNFFQGGLDKCLKDFGITFNNGEKLTKLSMEYNSTELNENRINYMRNDVVGLYKLVEKASEFVINEFGINLLDLKKLTSGSLAKSELLKFLYPNLIDFKRAEKFRKKHPLSIEQDIFFRSQYLYSGGKCLVNSLFKNKIYNGKIYYYDRNSMYPSEMAKMPDLIGEIQETTCKKYLEYYSNYPERYTCILEISDFHFIKKSGALEILYNPIIREYVDEFEYTGQNLLYFDFEFMKILEFYDINEEYEIPKVYIIRNYYRNGNSIYSDFINKWYTLKATSKKEGNKILNKFAKLILNSSYGKLAQNPVSIKTHRELDESGIVKLIKDKDENEMPLYEMNETIQMSLLQGAYITAKARVNLMNTMIISSENDACKTKKYIHYCDTDSIQTTRELPSYMIGDDLGQWKLETGKYFDFGKWLAPKTYILGRYDENGIPFDLEVHTKGVNVEVVRDELKNKDICEIDKIFANNRKFQCLQGVNVKGGKALIPLVKTLNNEKENKITNIGEY